MSNNQPPRRGVERVVDAVRYNVLECVPELEKDCRMLAICPFCFTEVWLYSWSLARQGKKCNCGARFFSDGTAERRL